MLKFSEGRHPAATNIHGQDVYATKHSEVFYHASMDFSVLYFFCPVLREISSKESTCRSMVTTPLQGLLAVQSSLKIALAPF